MSPPTLSPLLYLITALLLLCPLSHTSTAPKPCDHCSCHLTALRTTTPIPTARRGGSVLVVNCTRTSQISNTIRPPDYATYQQLSYTEIHAEFESNKIVRVDRFDFKRVSRLNLARNEIRYIEDGAFAKLSMLRDLDLSHNKLNKAGVNGKTFEKLKILETLNLYDTGLGRLDADVFADLASLRHLDLGHNFLVGQLDPSLFAPLENLRELSLGENALTGIHGESFGNLRELRRLVLAGNQLEALKGEVFQSLEQLVHLDLSSNKLTSIEAGTFDTLSHLDTLDLSNNELSRLQAGGSSVLSSLRVLRVGHNRLEDAVFLDAVFQLQDKLQEVHVEHNSLTGLEFVKSLTQIQVLNASSNRIADFPPHTFPLLHTLDLSNNTLATVPGIVTSQYLPSLRSLSLDMNPIVDLVFPPSPLPFPLLVHVSLSHMQELERVQATAFQALAGAGRQQQQRQTQGAVVKRETATSVEHFVDYNEEDYLHDASEGDEVVEGGGEDKAAEGKAGDGVEDTEKGERMTEGEEEVADGSDESEEDVKGNEELLNLEIDGWNSDEGDMHAANLRNGPGRVQDDVESYYRFGRPAGKSVVACKSLLVLKISHNKNLVSVEEGAFVGVDMCELDLSYNSLSDIPEKAVDWRAVPSVDLQGNPWDCSCRLQWLLETIVPKLYNTEPELLYELRCGTPPLLRDRRFVHFYNWSEPAFCTHHKERMREAPAQDQPGDVTTDLMLRLGGSGGMLIVVGVACVVVCALVGAGVWLQRRQTLQRRARNRRV